MILLWCSLSLSVFQVNLSDIPEEVLERYRRRVYFVERTPRPRARDEEFVEPVPVEQPPGFVVTDSDSWELGGPEDPEMNRDPRETKGREAEESEGREAVDVVRLPRVKRGKRGRRDRVPGELVDVKEKVTRKPSMELEKGRGAKRLPNTRETYDEGEGERKKSGTNKGTRMRPPTAEQIAKAERKEEKDVDVKKYENAKRLPNARKKYEREEKEKKFEPDEVDKGTRMRLPAAKEIAKAKKKEEKDWDVEEDVDVKKYENVKRLPNTRKTYDEKKDEAEDAEDRIRMRLPAAEEIAEAKQKEEKDVDVKKYENAKHLTNARKKYEREEKEKKFEPEEVDKDTRMRPPTAKEIAKAEPKEEKKDWGVKEDVGVDVKEDENAKRLPNTRKTYDEKKDEAKDGEDRIRVRLPAAEEIAEAKQKEEKNSKRIAERENKAKDDRQEPLKHDARNQNGAYGWTIPNRIQLIRAVQKDDIVVIEGERLEAVKSCRVCDVVSNPLSVTSNAVECPIPKKARGQCSVKLSNGDGWSDESIFFSINYTPNWTQITVIIVLLCCGVAICLFLFRAIGRPLLWKSSQPGKDVEDERTPFLETSSEIVQE